MTTRRQRSATALLALIAAALFVFAWTAANTGASQPQANAARCVPAKKPVRIVVIGSSIAYGIGATPRENSWAALYSKYLKTKNRRNKLINLAMPGYTSPRLMPTGSPDPAATIDPGHNITAALAKKPNAVILALTTNDAAAAIPPAESLARYQSIVKAAAKKGVKVWVTTPAPRTLDPAGQQRLVDLLALVKNTYGRKSLDFWTPITEPSGQAIAQYGAGDGIHPNNAGHALLYKQVVKAKIPRSLTCR